jgi:hypothetical protein
MALRNLGNMRICGREGVAWLTCQPCGWVAGVESSSPQQSIRLTDDSRLARDNHRQAEVDDLFAQWDSDPLALLSAPDLGMKYRT